MRPPNEFNQLDEVIVISNRKRGIVLEYTFSENEGVYNYLIDCEEEVLTHREQELRRVW